jgi:hypothetical protein
MVSRPRAGAGAALLVPDEVRVPGAGVEGDLAGAFILSATNRTMGSPAQDFPRTGEPFRRLEPA